MGATLLFSMVLMTCLALSFLLSGMEAGVLALSRFRIRRQMRAGLRNAQRLNQYLENPEEFLWTILVGNTLAAFGAFSLVVMALFHLVPGQPWIFALAFGIFAYLFYVLCDLLPKMLFRQFPNRLSLALALPFRLLHVALSPLVAVVTRISDLLLRMTGRERFKGHVFSSRHEMRLAIQESAQMLTTEERSMVNRVLDLQDLTVRSIAVPLNRIVGVTKQTTVRQLLELGGNQSVVRCPVWDADAPGKRIIGIVNLSTILYSDDVNLDGTVASYVKPPLIFREDVRLEEALRRMQRTRQRMAVVVGFDQRELGIIKLRDILQSIFGEVTL